MNLLVRKRTIIAEKEIGKSTEGLGQNSRIGTLAEMQEEVKRRTAECPHLKALQNQGATVEASRRSHGRYDWRHSTSRTSPHEPTGASAGESAPGEQPELGGRGAGSSRRPALLPRPRAPAHLPSPGCPGRAGAGRPPGSVPGTLTALAHAAGAQHGQFDVLGQEVVGGGLGDGRQQKVPGHGGRPHGERRAWRVPPLSASLPPGRTASPRPASRERGNPKGGDRGAGPAVTAAAFKGLGARTPLLSPPLPAAPGVGSGRTRRDCHRRLAQRLAA